MYVVVVWIKVKYSLLYLLYCWLGGCFYLLKDFVVIEDLVGFLFF